MSKKIITIAFVSILLLSGCATTSKVAQNISLGMTTQEVIKSSGKPFSKNISKDSEGCIIEEWSYRETTWDDGGWSWDRTIVNTVITFENGRVKSMSNEGEKSKTKNPMAPTLNLHNTLHQE